MIFRGTYNLISNDAQIFIMSDNMDYYINLSNSANQAAIWKYSTLSNQCICYDFSQKSRSFYGSLMLGDDQLFLTGKDASTSTLFHMYMINFNTNSYNWAKTISCLTDCSNYLKESIQSSDNSKIYSLLPLELSRNAYFITLNSTDGSAIGSRYKSSISWSPTYGSTRNGDNLVFSVLWSQTYNLFIYNTNSSSFSINSWNASPYGMTTEPSTNR